MSRNELIEMGFKEMEHFTVGNSLTFELGRNRHLSVSCLGDPNETVFICEVDKFEPKKINDLICLHNYDYDGYVTIQKITLLIAGIGISKRNLTN